jgi:hypothetical protein
MDEGDGRPSRWNTLRALRVLDWHGGRPSGSGSPRGSRQVYRVSWVA